MVMGGDLSMFLFCTKFAVFYFLGKKIGIFLENVALFVCGYV